MDHAITIGDVVKFVLVAGGIVGVLAILVAIMAAIGRGYSM